MNNKKIIRLIWIEVLNICPKLQLVQAKLTLIYFCVCKQARNNQFRASSALLGLVLLHETVTRQWCDFLPILGLPGAELSRLSLCSKADSTSLVHTSCLTHLAELWNQLKMSGVVEGKSKKLKNKKEEKNGLGKTALQKFTLIHYISFSRSHLCVCPGQMLLLDRFFDGTFFTYGIEVMSFADRDQEDRIDPMIYVFPRQVIRRKVFFCLNKNHFDIVINPLPTC